MTGFYLLCFLLLIALVIDQQTTINVLTVVSLKIQVYYVNLRLKWAAWTMYRSLAKQCKENGFPEPGPFKFVDIWDRDPLN